MNDFYERLAIGVLDIDLDFLDCIIINHFFFTLCDENICIVKGSNLATIIRLYHCNGIEMQINENHYDVIYYYCEEAQEIIFKRSFI